MKRPAVAVIGAGAIGLATAVHLTQLGVDDVVVLERVHPASGSSGLSVGIVETQYLDPLDVEIRVRSGEFFAHLEREHGLEIVHNGYLRLAHTEKQVAAFEESVRVQRSLGIMDATVLDPGEVERLLPDMRCDDITAGLFGPNDGYLDGHLYCALLVRLAESHGARVVVGAKLTGVSQGTRCPNQLETSTGTFECDVVVNAAGAWAPEVGAILNAELPLMPQRHQAVSVHLPRTLDYIVPSVMDYTPRSGEYGLYFRHEGPGRLIAGLHSEEARAEIVDPDNFTRAVDATFVETVAHKLASRLPRLSDARVGSGWAGLYPVSPDGRPQVGPHPTNPTVVLACGGGGSGLQSSPAIGRLAAEWIVFGEARSLSGAEALLPGRPSLSFEPPA